MTEPRKIFISHHNSDASALGMLKEELEPMGFRCFLAHVDIEPGEHDLERIKEEAKNCDAMVYIGSEAANKSFHCQQEVGMAIGLGKKIITTITKGIPPVGFIRNVQAISRKEIDINFCEEVNIELIKKIPPTAEQCLEILGVTEFTQFHDEEDKIYLMDVEKWDDNGFRTMFRLKKRNKYMAHVKIAYMGQTRESSTHAHNKLYPYFKRLDFPFFSHVYVDPSENKSLSSQELNALRVLLNDTKIMSKADHNKVIGQEVYKQSLFRK